MRIRALMLVTPLVGALLFVLAGPAGAVGQVTVSNGAPAPGTALAVTSTGWFPGRAVSIALSGTEAILGNATADATGSIHAQVTVPADAVRATDVLSVTGTASSGVPQQIVTALAVHSDRPVRAPARPWVVVIVLAAIAGALLLASVTVVSPTHQLAH